jgi:hypothetical protein
VSASREQGEQTLLTLPVDWTQFLGLVNAEQGPGLIRLSRRFQSPKVDPASESVCLRLENVPGLMAAYLNDQPLNLKLVQPDSGLLEIPLQASAEQVPCLLKLEVSMEGQQRTSGGTEPPAAWGSIALVIRRQKSEGSEV